MGSLREKLRVSPVRWGQVSPKRSAGAYLSYEILRPHFPAEATESTQDRQKLPLGATHAGAGARYQTRHQKRPRARIPGALPGGAGVGVRPELDSIAGGDAPPLPKDVFEVAPAGSGSPSPNWQNRDNCLDSLFFFSRPGRREAPFATRRPAAGRCLERASREPPGSTPHSAVKSEIHSVFQIVPRSTRESGPVCCKLAPLPG